MNPPIVQKKETMQHSTSSRIMVATSSGTYFFNPEEIIRLEACSNYTYIYLTNHTKLFTAKVLKAFAAKLEPMGFIRTHRTHLVNQHYITHICNDGTIMMQDSSMAEVSRRKRVDLMRILKNAS